MKPRSIIHPKFRSFEAAISEILKRFDQQGRLLYSGRNTIKVVDMPPYTINIKRFKRPHIFNRIAYTFLRKSKCERAYLHSEQIIRRGFNTPQPVACFIMTQCGLMSDSFYLSIHENYPRNMYEFGQGGIAEREDIIKAFARYTAALHEARIFHRDYSPGNILFEVRDARCEFCLVDTNRMSFGKVSIAKGCSAFAALWGDEAIFNLIANEYADARKADAFKCRRLIARSRRIFWKRYSAKHGKPY
ncbi:MAG: tyrosine protein kinase [Tannerellaceae bacterium]|jgi:serine/threonine protein kinase|nr:tyrosine protein kinase [Tannerellaceae bacterium]